MPPHFFGRTGTTPANHHMHHSLHVIDPWVFYPEPSLAQSQQLVMSYAEAVPESLGPSRKRKRTESHVTDDSTPPRHAQVEGNTPEHFQRAFRQRTRHQIADLEERVANQAHLAARKAARLTAKAHALQHQTQVLQRCLNTIADLTANLDSSDDDDGHGRDNDPDHDPRDQDQLPSPNSTQQLTAADTTSDVVDPNATSNLPSTLSHFSLYPPQITSTVSAVMPSHLPPTCPLDRILLNLLSSRRDMVAQGTPLDTVLGPPKAIMTALIDKSLASTVHPISRVISEVLSTFPNVELPQKMGMFYKIYFTMRVHSPSSFHVPHLFTSARLTLWPTVADLTYPRDVWPHACLVTAHCYPNSCTSCCVDR